MQSMAVLSAMLQQRAPTAPALGAALGAQGKAARWEMALSLLMWARSAKFPLNTATSNICITACGAARKWDHALALFWNMTGDSSPNVITLNAAISACAAASQWVYALHLFSQAHALALKPNMMTHTSLIGAFAAVQKWEAALEQLRILSENHLVPDTVGLNAVIAASSQAREWAATLSLVQHSTELGLEDSFTLNTVMAAFQGSGRWELAIEQFSALRSANCTADEVTYRSLVSVAVRDTAMAVALSCFRDAVDVGLSSHCEKAERHVIDMHGLPLEAAWTAFCRTLLAKSLQNSASEIIIVVGVGHGSSAGQRVVAGALLDMLRLDLDPPVEVLHVESNAGRLRVPAESVSRWLFGIE